jgi:hypothetical protein
MSIAAKYKCCECGEVLDDVDKARYCCHPRVDEVFMCPICQSPHDLEEFALDCCGFDPDGPPPPPSAAELEAAGQLRLVP